LGRNLFELRQYRSLTQEEVAERAGSTQPKIASAERGKANLTLKSIRKLIKALDGRLRISIEPAEMNRPYLGDWWESHQEFPPLSLGSDDPQGRWEQIGETTIYLVGGSFSGTQPIEEASDLASGMRAVNDVLTSPEIEWTGPSNAMFAMIPAPSGVNNQTTSDTGSSDG
jgi:transcriptional regulator with XRE-family HTH domain